MNQLHTKAGDFIANLLGSEAAYITCGTAASLAISVAACVTGGDSRKTGRPPGTDETEDMPNEIIIQKLHRNIFDYGIELAGAKIVETGNEQGTTPQDLDKAIKEKIAAVLYFAFDPQEGVLPLDAF